MIYITAIVPAASKQLLSAGDEEDDDSAGFIWTNVCGAASVSSKLSWELFRSSEISVESSSSGEVLLFSVLLCSPRELVEQDSFLLVIFFS